MSLFHFIRPEWFFALIPLLLCYWLLIRLNLKNKSWQNFCDADLLPHLFQQSNIQKKKRPLFLFVIAGLIAITALAGPSWEKRPQPVFKKQSALVIVLDLSRSMDATDIKPSRITRALHKVEDILQRRQEGQTGLIVYAGDAFTVTPLTEDTATISSQVKSLNTAIMPIQGSNTGKAIKLAHSLFKQTSQIRGHILLITDGIGHDAINITESLLDNNYTLSVLGVGTTEGAPIPLSDGGFFKDANGAIVIPRLDSNKLQSLALSGSGSFRTLSTDDSDIDFLLNPLDSKFDSNNGEATELNTDSWFEAGPWLLLLLLPIAAFTFRKGYLFVFVLFIIPQPDQAYALELEQLWKNDNQRAQDLFEKNKAKQAAEIFSNDKWKAAAEYKSGQYQKALESYQKLDTSDSDNVYNLANTQAKLGQLDKALENYNKLIDQDPNHTDAKYNRDQVEKMQQQQSEKNKSKDSKDKQDKKNDKENKNNESKDSDKQSKDSSKEKDSSDEMKDGKDSKDKDSEEEKKQSKDKPATDKEETEEKKAEQKQLNEEKDQLSKEQKQANEQWLRRIPDDPGGLLRRKFQYQSQQRQNKNSGEQQW